MPNGTRTRPYRFKEDEAPSMDHTSDTEETRENKKMYKKWRREKRTHYLETVMGRKHRVFQQQDVLTKLERFVYW